MITRYSSRRDRLDRFLTTILPGAIDADVDLPQADDEK